MATIQKIQRSKGNVYRVLIRKKNFKTITKVFHSKKEAIAFSQEIEGNRKKYLSYASIESSNLTFNELVSAYLLTENKDSRPREKTHKLRYWNTSIGNMQVRDIAKRDICQALSKLKTDYSNATINRYKAAVSVVFAFACRHYGLAVNPSHNIPSLPENNVRVRFLSKDEKARLFEACKASSWNKLYLLVLMAITTGARKGELTKLRWSDISFDRQTAFVRTSKNGEPKVLPLTNAVIRELHHYKEDSGLLFHSPSSIEKEYCFRKPWCRALEVANIYDFRFHDLRHTTASYLAQNGASLLEIADVLGHKQIQVTKRYAHLCTEHKAKLINRVMSDI